MLKNIHEALRSNRSNCTCKIWGKCNADKHKCICNTHVDCLADDHHCSCMTMNCKSNKHICICSHRLKRGCCHGEPYVCKAGVHQCICICGFDNCQVHTTTTA